MKEPSDDALLRELSRRLLDSRKAQRDVTVMNQKIEKLNVKLAESERLKSNFLSNIRNEINNPLTSILGMSKDMAAHPLDAERIRSLALMIYGEAFSLDFQLRNIFAAAEIEAGAAAAAAARIDPEALIRHVADSFAHRAAAKDVAVEVVFSGEPDGARPAFVTDPEKFRLVMANLIANAVEYNEKGRTVRIDGELAQGSLRLSITDEGRGISEADRERLFERFRQLDQGPSKRHKGHGLGLSITRSLVALLGGSVSLTRAEGGGTRFDLVIPEAAGAPVDVFSEDGNEFLFEEGTSSY